MAYSVLSIPDRLSLGFPRSGTLYTQPAPTLSTNFLRIAAIVVAIAALTAAVNSKASPITYRFTIHNEVFTGDYPAQGFIGTALTGGFNWSCSLTTSTSSASCISSVTLQAEGQSGWAFSNFSLNLGNTYGPYWSFTKNAAPQKYDGLDIYKYPNTSPDVLGVLNGVVFTQTPDPNNGLKPVLDQSIVAVPSPPDWLMMLTGLALMAPLYRRHWRTKARLDRGIKLFNLARRQRRRRIG